MVPEHPCSTVKRTRILVVDDHPVVREGLAVRIQTQPDLIVCGEAEDVAGALAQLGAVRPEVAIVDLALKTGNGIELIKRLKARDPALRIIVCSMYDESLYAERALRAGAMGYVHKGRATREILEAIRSVQDGKVFLSAELSSEVLGRLIGRTRRKSAYPAIETLSDRELETFELIGQGLTTDRVAERMNVSPKTVETYRSRIKEKLGLSSFTEVVQRAVQWMVERV
jgi:DNA-binding NarL/FixJ family response regulator